MSDGNEEDVDWGLDNDDEEDQYKMMIETSLQEDKINEMKKLGISDSSMLPSNILNFKSVKLFEGSRCY